ncbi:aminoglycoside 3'-phosphotransferase [Streptomyces sp. JJ36]|uniref:aminoglycoside 3'-phosphotransferase n=1 Tax=Streptomyces sp. JJ36 TaxID=2736645 RepID=UPI001F1EE42F|nr:aminoglycoside 3'-phosphotransferase [Streptomyces sp. JJ36]MCF6525267.1 aminoglycoside 3'-phosphotransferase [Streptomyces sp. JJ36]
MPFAGPPSPDVPVPAPVTALARGRALLPVWRNERGGLTFRMGDGPGRLFVKWAPAGSGLDLAAEAERLRWAVRFTPVPRVREEGADAGGSWLVTEGLPGESAVGPRGTADPATAVRAVGEGLRALHERLPVEGCPFDWSAGARLERARRAGRRAPAEPPAPPPADRLVVCHGDACAPNTLLGEDGSWSGHVDMGALGVADRWADLAVATWATEWNYGPGWERPLLDAYGIAPDPERTAYYRWLWSVT